jgi:hypothetical protein
MRGPSKRFTTVSAMLNPLSTLLWQALSLIIGAMPRQPSLTRGNRSVSYGWQANNVVRRSA